LGVAGQVSQNPLEVVLGVDSNGVLRLDPKVAEPSTHSVSTVTDLSIGEPLIVGGGSTCSKARQLGIGDGGPLETGIKGHLVELGTSEFLLQVRDIQEVVVFEHRRSSGQGLALRLLCSDFTGLNVGILWLEGLSDFSDNVPNRTDLVVGHGFLCVKEWGEEGKEEKTR
jgi:hypothetical protein